MSIVLDGTTGLAGAATGALNGTLGATTPSTVAATTVVASSTIKGATTIAVGNATPSASGAGITFPATQSVSTDANTLDDYEEGTWTPVPTSLTVVGTPTYTGTYVKVGNIVSIWCKLSDTTSVASTANTTYISGLPFTVGTMNSVIIATTQNVNNIGTGFVVGGNTVAYTPTWSAYAAVYLTATYSV